MNKFLLLSLLLGAVSLPAAAQKRATLPVFLVTDVAIDGDVGIDGETAQKALAQRFGRLKGKIEVRSMTEARAGIDAAALAQLLGEADDDKLMKLEEYVKVDRVVFGRIAKKAGITTLTVALFNTAEGVAEASFQRRLKEDAASSMVLTVLDKLADTLLAFVLDNYTDGARSAKAEALANKKPTKAAAVDDNAPRAPLSWWSAIGGLTIGAGLGSLGVVTYDTVIAGEPIDDSANLAWLITGSALVAAGTTVIIIDALTE